MAPFFDVFVVSGCNMPVSNHLRLYSPRASSLHFVSIVHPFDRSKIHSLVSSLKYACLSLSVSSSIMIDHPMIGRKLTRSSPIIASSLSSNPFDLRCHSTSARHVIWIDGGFEQVAVDCMA